MTNKENGTKRPCYFCFKDKKYKDIIWFVTISSKVSKYKEIYKKKKKTQKRVLNFVFGNVLDNEKVFFVQNIFPTLEKFIVNKYKTFFHEYSHMLDYRIGNPSQNKDFIKMIYNDFNDFKEKLMNKYNIDENTFYLKFSNKMKKDYQNNSLSDIIGAITGNKCIGKGFHNIDYWEDKGKIGREFYAHIGSALIRNSEKEIYNFKTIFPNAYNYYIKSLKGK